MRLPVPFFCVCRGKTGSAWRKGRLEKARRPGLRTPRLPDHDAARNSAGESGNAAPPLEAEQQGYAAQAAENRQRSSERRGIVAKGRLVVLDGLDGSGKSTQFERLGEYMQERGIHYKSISFPDYDQPSSALVKMYLGGEFGSSPDDVNAYAASSFYAVDRYASYKKFWQADYEGGALVLAARYTTSNAIHQMSKLPRERWDEYLAWLETYEYGLLGLPRPDRVIFLDMPLTVAQSLLAGRYGGDGSRKDIHERDLRYLEKCRESALYAAEKRGWSVVDCACGGEPLPPGSITAELLRLIQPDRKDSSTLCSK